MTRYYKIFFVLFFICSTGFVFAQSRASLAADVALMRNFSKQQQFWALGQTVQGIFHLDPKNGAYVLVNYYVPGKFKNSYTATAISTSTNPYVINYNVSGRWFYRQISIGWRRYMKGNFDEENTWSLYGLAGFGLLFTKAQNTLEDPVDLSLYTMAERPAIGETNFTRLTFDLGAGIDFPLGEDTYLYTELKTWIPATEYPSNAFHQDARIPYPLILTAGIRLAFGNNY